MQLMQTISTYVLATPIAELMAWAALVIGLVLLGIYCSSDVTGRR